MKTKALVSLVLAAALATSGLASAQGNSRHGDRGDDRGDDRRNDRSDREYRHDNRDFGRSHNEHMRHGRGAGPGHQYYQGDRYPMEYRNRHYVVNDWRSHNLSAPPRGYQWVQSGNDYVMVAIATGIIAQLLLGR